MRLSAVAEKGDGPQTAAESPGVLGGYEFFQDLNLEELAENAAQSALRMAAAGYIDGGKMPVILGNGFGGVIFHEACGHPLETEAIRKKRISFLRKNRKACRPVDSYCNRRWNYCKQMGFV